MTTPGEVAVVGFSDTVAAAEVSDELSHETPTIQRYCVPLSAGYCKLGVM